MTLCFLTLEVSALDVFVNGADNSADTYDTGYYLSEFGYLPDTALQFIAVKHKRLEAPTMLIQMDSAMRKILLWK